MFFLYLYYICNTYREANAFKLNQPKQFLRLYIFKESINEYKWDGARADIGRFWQEQHCFWTLLEILLLKAEYLSLI